MAALDPAMIARLLAGELDRAGERSLSHQIADGLWTGVVDGSIATGARMPTVRQLAVELELHPKVVAQAYEQLRRRGVVSVQADGLVVCLTDGDPGAPQRAAALDQACRDFAARAEALGFTLDDAVEALSDLRLDRSSRNRS